MGLMFWLKLYLGTFAAFLAIDMVWLGFVAKSFYRKHLGALMRPKPNWAVALIFYMLFVAGILIFAVVPAKDSGSLIRAAVLGGLFGLFTYGTYDLTNWATLKGWPPAVVIVDMVWGIVLCAAVSVIGTLLIPAAGS